MKRLTVILIVISIFFSCFSISMADSNSNDLHGDMLIRIGLLPDDSESGEGFVTREILAYAISNIYRCGELEPIKTKFEDVTADNKYSGYINFVSERGLMIGTSDNTFMPKDSITLEQLNKVSLTILGYGFLYSSNSYNSTDILEVARNKGLMNGISLPTNSFVTYDNFSKYMFNLMISSVDTYVTHENGRFDMITDTGMSVLGSIMRFSIYEGYITGFLKNGSARVYIKSNKLNTNYKLLANNAYETFGVGSNVDTDIYEYAPAKIWVDENSKIVYVDTNSNVTVGYKRIYSVNGDAKESEMYNLHNARYMNFYDDDTNYKIASDCKVKYNFKDYNGLDNYAGELAKVVIVDDEIVFVHTWDLTSAGIISKIDDANFNYINTSGENSLQEDYSTKRRVLVVDGESRHFSDLRENSTVYYYYDDDTIIVFACEKIISDKIQGFDGNTVLIGSFDYDTSDDVSYSKDGVTYTSGTKTYIDYIGSVVDMYINPYGKAQFIKLSHGADDKSDKEFVGMMIACTEGEGLEKSDKIIRAKVLKLEPEIETIIYNVSKNVKYGSGITTAFLKRYSGNVNDENSFFKFILDNSGEISKIDVPEYYDMGSAYEKTINDNLTKLPNEADSYLSTNAGGVYTKYFDRLIGIYTDKYDDISAKQIKYTDIRNSTCTDVKLALFGKEGETTVRLAVLFGNTESIVNGSLHQGIAKNKCLCMDENGVNYYSYELTSTEGKMNIEFSESEGASMPDTMYLSYYKKAFGAYNMLDITKQVDLTGDFNTWSSEFKVKKVLRSDGVKIFFQDGTSLFLDNQFFIAFEYNEDAKKDKFKQIYANNIGFGDTVAYSERNGITMTIVIK